MTKNVFKIGAVVLLICMLGAVGVSSAGIVTHNSAENAEFEIADAEFIWNISDKPLWTYKTNTEATFNVAPKIIVKAGTAETNHKYLAAYNVTFGGNLSALTNEANYVLGNLLTDVNTGTPSAFVQNKLNASGTLSSTEQGDETMLQDAKAGKKDIVSMTIKNEALQTVIASDDDPYNIQILETSELGLSNAQKVGEIEINGFFKSTSSDDVEIPFYVRENQPKVKNFDFSDYVKDVSGETVYIYREHGNVTVYTDGDDVKDKFDKTTWSSLNGTLFNVETTSEKTSDINSNNIILGDAGQRMNEGDYGNANLQVVVNDQTKDKSDSQNNVATTTTINVNLTNWNRTMESNEVSATQSNGIDEHGWNFKNGLGVTYTVGAGKMLDTNQNEVTSANPWNSYVDINKLNGNVWNAYVSYALPDGTPVDDKFEINGVTGEEGNNMLYGIGDSNKTFNVTKNDIEDGTKVVKITLGGFTKGDVDMDRGVDIVDSSIVGIDVIRDASKLIDRDSDNFKYADCEAQNSDGEITVADVRAINMVLVGLAPWTITP